MEGFDQSPVESTPTQWQIHHTTPETIDRNSSLNIQELINMSHQIQMTNTEMSMQDNDSVENMLQNKSSYI